MDSNVYHISYNWQKELEEKNICMANITKCLNVHIL